MKLDNKIFIEFLKKCTLKGKIETCIIRSDGKSISIKSRQGTTIAVLGNLNVQTDMFVFPIKSSSKLIKILETFNDKISIEINDNIMKIFDENREADIVLADESFIDNEIKKDSPFIYNDEGFSIKSDILKDSVRNSGIVNSNYYLFQIDNGIFSITTGDNNFDKMIEKIKVNYKNIKSNYGEIIVDVIQVLGDNITIFMNEDYPIKIIEKNKDMDMSYYIAHIEKEE